MVCHGTCFDELISFIGSIERNYFAGDMVAKMIQTSAVKHATSDVASPISIPVSFYSSGNMFNVFNNFFKVFTSLVLNQLDNDIIWKKVSVVIKANDHFFDNDAIHKGFSSDQVIMDVPNVNFCSKGLIGNIDAISQADVNEFTISVLVDGLFTINGLITFIMVCLFKFYSSQ